jgi:tRNA A37 threonylcarbamoyladenosine modification protein TsaB
LIHLKQSLSQINHSLKDVDEIYFTSQRSGQTGLRVSLSFLATLQVLNPQIKIYHIGTLLLQAGNNNSISLLTIDSQGNKYYLAVYQNKKYLLQNQIVAREELNKIKEKFSDFIMLKDFHGTDFLTNFQNLKNNFSQLNKIEEANC